MGIKTCEFSASKEARLKQLASEGHVPHGAMAQLEAMLVL